MPKPGVDLIRRRHAEFVENETRWRWLLDSLEGGERYRQAVYGQDARGYPVRNLVRHKREYPEPGAETRSQQGLAYPGADPAVPASDDDYELRRARTPVPTFVPEVVDTYLGKLLGRQKVKREAPDGGEFDPLRAWWENVDGKGTPIDRWILEDLGRSLLALGTLDVLFDRPAVPPGETIATRADELRLGLDACVASVILPQNVPWWRLNRDGSYAEVLVREHDYDDAGKPRCRYRHWTDSESVLYDEKGDVVTRLAHSYGRVPIVRLMVRRKPRLENVGGSPLESIAERQREYYNRDSELILSDTIQAHPLLQGPEDIISADGTMPLGPGWLLPKKKNVGQGGVSYEGFDVVDFPKGASESIRLNKSEIRDDVDRDAALTKPAGAKGTSRMTVAQSGVAKEIDQDAFFDRLSGLSRIFAGVEGQMAELVLLVTGGPSLALVEGEVGITYPTVFGLQSAEELLGSLAEFQAALEAAGRAPEAETLWLSEAARKAMPGYDDETYQRIDTEIAAAVRDAAGRRQQSDEGGNDPPPGNDPNTTPAIDPAEDDVDQVDDQEDPATTGADA
jgi:hypothetical protein